MIASSRRCLTVGFTLVAALAAFAGDVKVVANPSVKTNSISTAELRGVFLLQRKKLNDGSKAEPVLQKAGASHDAFVKRYLNRDSEEIEIYYQGLLVTGKGSMPKRLNSDAEVVAYVASTSGAIGYVSSTASTERVKVLVVVSGESKGERALLSRVEPELPDTLQRLGIDGIVRLELTISPKGTVETVRVLGGNPILGEAAIRAAKQWVYAPAPAPTTTSGDDPVRGAPLTVPCRTHQAQLGFRFNSPSHSSY